MFEVINSFNYFIKYIFINLEYRESIQNKNILPIEEIKKTFTNDLLKYRFDNENITTDILSDIYMILMRRLAYNSGKKGGEFFTPTQLVKNAWKFVDIKKYVNKLINNETNNISICDPTSGSNTFLMYGYNDIIEECEKIKQGVVNKNSFSFYGQELKKTQYCLGLINMIFNGLNNQYNKNIEIKDQNSNVITNYLNGIGLKRNTIDIVVANPPYALKDYGFEYAQQTKETDERWKFGIPVKKESEYSFLMTAYDLLNEQGKAIILMPVGTLFRKSGENFRKQLLQDGVVECLIYLPENMFLTTYIPVVMWILNKDKTRENKDKIFMINASEDFYKVGKLNEWKVEKSINNYLNKIEETGYSGYVDYKTLEDNKFNFVVKKYFFKEQKEEFEKNNTLSLEKEIKELKNKINKIELITNEFIKENNEEINYLKINEIVTKVPKNWKVKKIKDLIYLNKIINKNAKDFKNSGLYPAFTSSKELTKYYDEFNFDNENIYIAGGGHAAFHYYNGKATCSSSVLSFKSKGEIDNEFLYYLLIYNIKLIERCFYGTSLPQLNTEEFLNLKICFPEIEEQINIKKILKEINYKKELTKELILKEKDNCNIVINNLCSGIFVCKK